MRCEGVAGAVRLLRSGRRAITPVARSTTFWSVEEVEVAVVAVGAAAPEAEVDPGKGEAAALHPDPVVAAPVLIVVAVEAHQARARPMT